MDHLPEPIDDHHVAVPFFAELKEYQPGDFFKITKSYMDDHNLTSLDDLIDKGFEINNNKSNHSRLNQLVQSWLLFALLAQVVGEPIDARKFRIPDQNLLTTHGLSTVLRDWAVRWREGAERSEPKDISKQKNEYVQASMALEFARRFCWKHLAYRPREEDDYGRHSSPQVLQAPHDKLNSPMVLSIMSIGEILQDELWTRLPPRQKDRVQFWKQPEDEERNWGYSHWCREQMRKDGWCPSEIRRTEGTMPHVNVIYYACSIKRGSDEHREACTAWECKVESQETESLTALHSNRCGRTRCGGSIGPGNMVFENTSLEEIIDNKLIPLVRWTKDGKLQCKGHNLDVDSPITFGAVSHSWADKILNCGVTPGDQNNRSMLRCQLEGLRRDFAAIFDDIDAEEKKRLNYGSSTALDFEPWKKQKHQEGEEPWFWIDVLCFPHDWRGQAQLLNRLHTIYEKAAAVLIWDRNLLNREEPAFKNYIETTVRLNTGQWSRRLWTLPEAVLAKSLYVGFRSGYLPLSQLENACESARADILSENYFIWKAGRPFTSSISHIRAQLYNQDPGTAHPSLEHALPVQSVWKALQFREASVLTDQIIVLASVLGLDVSRFLENDSQPSPSNPVISEDSGEAVDDSEWSMIEFLNALDETPGLGIPSGLIFLPHPKLSQKSYGWAPKTWMSKQLYTYPLFRPANKTGYMMPHGLHVEFPGLILHCPTPVIDAKDFWVPVSQTLTKWYKVEIDAVGTSIEKLREDLDPKHEHCIILNAAKTRERWEAGLFVKRNGLLACGEVWRVQPICRLWVRLETRTSMLQHLKRNFYEDAWSQYFGERVESQRWCIENPLKKFSKL